MHRNKNVVKDMQKGTKGKGDYEKKEVKGFEALLFKINGFA